MKLIIHTFCLFILLVCCADAARIPKWAKPYVEQEIPEEGNVGHSVEVYRETLIEVSPNQKYTERIRCVLKVLDSSGERDAVLGNYYSVEDHKVLGVKAWLLRDDGQVLRYGKEDLIHYSSQGSGTLYDDRNRLYLSANNDAKTDSYFIYEYKIRRKNYFSQFLVYLPYPFVSYSPKPYLDFQYKIRLPKNWSLRYTYRNGADFNYFYKEQENLHFWSAKLIRQKVDDFLIDYASMRRELRIDIFPDKDSEKQEGKYRYFESWRDIAKYSIDLEEGCLVVDSAIESKVQELVSEKQTLEEKIKAIAYYVQSINYISISEETSFGGGYRPHKAVDIFRLNYGDCKDKTLLLRAMLSCIGVDAYGISCYSGDYSRVDPTWPSPFQFNHKIVGIKVPVDFENRACVDVPSVGRILMFDPTDHDLALGDLPKSIQGNFACLDHLDVNDLIEIPDLSDDYEFDKRSYKARIAEDGSISFDVKIDVRGQEADYFKFLARKRSKKKFREWVEEFLDHENDIIALEELEYRNEHDAGTFHLEAKCSSTNYAKNTRGFLLSFNPVILPCIPHVYEDVKERKTAIYFNKRSHHDTIEFELPDGFQLDEKGEDFQVIEDFGSYSVNYSIEGKYLKLERILDVKKSRLPKEESSRVRNFFKQVYDSERIPVVLVKD